MKTTCDMNDRFATPSITPSSACLGRLAKSPLSGPMAKRVLPKDGQRMLFFRTGGSRQVLALQVTGARRAGPHQARARGGRLHQSLVCTAHLRHPDWRPDDKLCTLCSALSEFYNPLWDMHNGYLLDYQRPGSEARPGHADMSHVNFAVYTDPYRQSTYAKRLSHRWATTRRCWNGHDGG